MTPAAPSPLLARPGAVASPLEPTLAWHYGDPFAEQRRAPRLIDRWTGGMVTVTGPDRLTWLHALASQDLESLRDGESAEALWLSPRGHVEHWADATELGGTVWLRTEADGAAGLAEYLQSMRFRADVEIRDVSDQWAGLAVCGHGGAAVLERAGITGMTPFAAEPWPGYIRPVPAAAVAGVDRDDRIEIVVARGDVAAVAQALIDVGAHPAGTWARDARRIAAQHPRFGVDNDDRTLPNETPWLATAVNLNKGCYRGQETVAKVRNIGRPPRRLVLLHLDGSADRLPAPGDEVTLGGGQRDSVGESGGSGGSGNSGGSGGSGDSGEGSGHGRVVGRVGTVAQHYEDGPIALALVKRTVAPGTPLLAGGVDALIDPDEVIADEPEVRIDPKQFYRFRRR